MIPCGASYVQRFHMKVVVLAPLDKALFKCLKMVKLNDLVLIHLN